MTYQDQSLAQLQADCQQQIKIYEKNSSSGEQSLSCLEIVRRAAKYGQDALAVMLELCRTFIYARCADDFYSEREDIAQEVYLRLMKKFNDKINPFSTGDFAGFRRYVNLTADSVIINLARQSKIKNIPIDGSVDIPSNDPDMAETLTKKEIVQRILDLLNKPLEREVLLRRHVYGQSIDEIVAALSIVRPDMTTEKIYRLIQYAKERLKKDPLLRRLMDL